MLRFHLFSFIICFSKVLFQLYLFAANLSVFKGFLLKQNKLVKTIGNRLESDSLEEETYHFSLS